MSDSHREQATTTDFAKPRDARQFWRVAGLARFSKRAEFKNVLRLVEGGCVHVGRSVSIRLARSWRVFFW